LGTSVFGNGVKPYDDASKKQIGFVFLDCPEEAEDFVGPRCLASVGFLPSGRSAQRLIRWRKTHAVMKGEAYWWLLADSFDRSGTSLFLQMNQSPGTTLQPNRNKFNHFPFL
jgi:hypothetical protein